MVFLQFASFDEEILGTNFEDVPGRLFLEIQRLFKDKLFY